ncbi:hypothetical protein HanIR_Chr03g0143951 [Helianthus annuus]|nr:hypothetical protein HanIR_Chr03g0143951 [Helianthus annuus]
MSILGCPQWSKCIPSSITVRVGYIPEPPSHHFREKLARPHPKAHCSRTRTGPVSN